jgi:copper chaperone
MGAMFDLAIMARSSVEADQPDGSQGHCATPIDLTMVARFKLRASSHSTRKDFPMNQSFQVKGMSCGHCVGAVTNAVKSVDPQAQVKVDLASGKVDVQSQQDHAAIAKAIEEEGYQVTA